MNAQKDTKAAKKGILQETVSVSYAEDPQPTEDKVGQCSIYVQKSYYQKARKSLKKIGMDPNAVWNAFIKKVSENQEYARAVVENRLSITTNNENYVQRQNDNHTIQNSSVGGFTSELLHE